MVGSRDHRSEPDEHVDLFGATLRPDGLAFAEPQYAEGAPRAAVQVAAVGEGVAVLDAEAGALTLPDGAVVAVDADPRSRLQRASEAADTVAVATASTRTDRSTISAIRFRFSAAVKYCRTRL